MGKAKREQLVPLTHAIIEYDFFEGKKRQLLLRNSVPKSNLPRKRF